MPQYETIRSYLVGLGWTIDQPSARRFEDALKKTAVMTEKFSKTAAKDFALVGGAFVATASAVAAGTVAMGLSVAKQDLQYQLMARRMFMTTDAVRKMTMATNALGLTLPEIIFGPPEVQERYKTLIQDETQMLKLLGSDQGESAFRRIRDIEFQFTRLGPALQIFGMTFTEDVINKMFGGTGKLEDRLKQFVGWFEGNIPKIADQWSNVLAPALLKVGGILGWIWDKAVGAGNAINGVTGSASSVPGSSSAPSTPDSGMSAIDKAIARSPGASKFQNFLMPQFDYKALARQYAAKWGLDPDFFARLIQAESGFNPVARNPTTGAYGFGQFMPGNMHMYGLDASNPDQNLDMSAHYLSDLLKKYGGDKRKALTDYGGFVTKDPNSYINSIIGPRVQPQSYSPTIHVGGIHVTSSNASPEQIKNAVRDGIDEHVRRASSQAYARSQGSYA
jgi:hypothetical protein